MGHLKQHVRYSEAFGLAVVKRVLSGEMSVIEACTHYGIGGKMSVYRWIKKYEQSEGISASSNPTTMALENESTSPREQASELASVKRLLELERLRSEALMKMIKLAEEKYGIAIEKKSGPKRSKR